MDSGRLNDRIRSACGFSVMDYSLEDVVVVTVFVGM